MSSLNLVRLSGLAAVLGSALGIVVTPILSYLWTTYSDAYGYYGRAYFLVFLGCLVGLTGLYARRRGSPGRSEAENWGFGLTFVGLSLGLVGAILDYWGGTPGEDFTQVQVRGFGLEIIGILLILVGSVMFGVVYWRAKVLPRLVAAMSILAGPGGILLSVVVVGHIPSGTIASLPGMECWRRRGC